MKIQSIRLILAAALALAPAAAFADNSTPPAHDHSVPAHDNTPPAHGSSGSATHR